MTKLIDPGQRAQLAQIASVELEKAQRQTELQPGIFAGNPALTIMLDLYVAETKRAKSQTVYVIEAARLPRGTGIRWLKHMEKLDLIERITFDDDRRSKFVELTNAGRATLENYLIACQEIDANR